MKNNSSKIFSFAGEMSPILVTLFWIAVIVNGALYATGIYFCVTTYQIGYPTQLWSGLLLNQSSMVLATTLVPYAILLDYWCLQKRNITIIYVFGCIIAIVLAIIAIVLIMPYGEKGYVEGEYFNSSKTREYPWQTISIGGETCCGWSSPLDFGLLVNISDHYQKDIKAMKNLSECYKVFNAQMTTNGTIIYTASRDFEDASKGCSKMLLKFFLTACIFIAGAMTWSILYTIVTCCVHLYTVHYMVGHDDNFLLPFDPEDA